MHIFYRVQVEYKRKKMLKQKELSLIKKTFFFKSGEMTKKQFVLSIFKLRHSVIYSFA